MNKVEVKIADLIGPALDWAVFCAVFNGMQPTIRKVESVTIERKPFIKPVAFPGAVWLTYSGAYGAELDWSPSSSWEQGGPLIEKHSVWLGAPYGSRRCWNASYHTSCEAHDGDTPLIAACRAIVDAKLGEVVRVPAELVQGGAL